MNKISLLPFVNLQTERLMLRRVADEDIDMIFAMRSDPHTMRFIPRPLLTDIQGAWEQLHLINEKLENDEAINWTIMSKETGKNIGIIGHYRIQPENFRAEVGYMIRPEFAGQGITTEAMWAVLNYGFQIMGLHSVEAIIDPEHSHSERVLLKCGFSKEAHLLENRYFEGKFLDSVVYSLLKRNFSPPATSEKWFAKSNE